MSNFKTKLKRLLSDSFADTRKSYNWFSCNSSHGHMNNKSCGKRNLKGVYSRMFSIDRFKNETDCLRLHNLLRTCTLRDLHNYLYIPEHSLSVSTLQVEEKERKTGRIQNQINIIKRNFIDLRKKNGLFINKPKIQFSSNLLRVNKKEIFSISPVKLTLNEKKGIRRYINYPKENEGKDLMKRNSWKREYIKIQF